MISIAIDGYSGSGKGELCKGLAKIFNLKHLDTGALLRAMGLYFYRQNNLNPTEEDVDSHFADLDISVEFDGDKQITRLAGEDVSTEIRQEAIGLMASKVAVIEKAMKKIIEISQAFALKYDCIMDGRNVTSEILPHADVKLFLTASIECRAKRRYDEDIRRGKTTTYEEILQSLSDRDWRDTHRAFSPMLVTADSTVVDNTTLSIEETIQTCEKIVREKLELLGKLR